MGGGGGGGGGWALNLNPSPPPPPSPRIFADMYHFKASPKGIWRIHVCTWLVGHILFLSKESQVTDTKRWVNLFWNTLPTKITLRCGTQQSYWAVFLDYHPPNDPKKRHCRISLFVTSFLLVSKCKGYLPVSWGYVIYSPGDAPRANCLRLNFRNLEIDQVMWSYQTVVSPERDE